MMVIIDHMDRLQSLEVFIAVAEAESFAEGARRMGLSAPSATRGVNALEGRLGVRLFTRTTRRVRLTEVGQSYLEDARHIVAQMQAADDDASALPPTRWAPCASPARTNLAASMSRRS